jgi:hypothetical protein
MSDLIDSFLQNVQDGLSEENPSTTRVKALLAKIVIEFGIAVLIGGVLTGLILLLDLTPLIAIPGGFGSILAFGITISLWFDRRLSCQVIVPEEN